MQYKFATASFVISTLGVSSVESGMFIQRDE